MTQNIFDRDLHIKIVNKKLKNILADPLIDQVNGIVQAKLEDIKSFFKINLENIYVTGIPINNEFNEYADLQDIESEKKFDVIISNLTFHFVNNPFKYIENVRKQLNDGGLFFLTFFGEETLRDAKNQIIHIELDETKRVYPRFIPNITLRAATQIMQKMHFKNVVCDVERITIEYHSVYQLMAHLNQIGQFHCMKSRGFINKHLYQRFKEPFAISANYDLISCIGFV